MFKLIIIFRNQKTVFAPHAASDTIAILLTAGWKTPQDLKNFSVLLLIHPNLYKIGSSILQNLRGLQDTTEIVSLWTSIFTGIAVISNRETPTHVDYNGRPEWYDLLTAKGSHSSRSTCLDLAEMGLSLAYGPGTVVALSGQIFQTLC
jgi:hypothetical protein